ncbi:hypothetical protein A2T76_05605 [Pseudomonas brenneri]|nr:hypothetical protein A2T76_05605 [Pseudomonas brenneri]
MRDNLQQRIERRARLLSLTVKPYRLTRIGGDNGQVSSPASRAPLAVKGSTTANPSPASTMLRII